MKKIKSISFVIIAACIGLASTSCCGIKALTDAELAGVWQLKTIGGVDAKTEFEGPIPTIEFNFENGQVAGSAGCNRYFGAFTLSEKNEFSAPELGSTMMMCAHKNAEEKFLNDIAQNGLVLSLKDNTLTFKKDKNTIFEFEKGAPKETQSADIQPVKEETLKGMWTLSANEAGNINTLYAEKKPTITFEDGKVNGFAGCNTYRGTYQLTDNTIAFSPLMMTRMACPDMEGETQFTKALTSPLQATINGNTLRLMQNGKLILEFTK